MRDMGRIKKVQKVKRSVKGEKVLNVREKEQTIASKM
jgi:hypothetical protein